MKNSAPKPIVSRRSIPCCDAAHDLDVCSKSKSAAFDIGVILFVDHPPVRRQG